MFVFNYYADCTAKVWDLERGIELTTLPKHPSYVRKVLFSEASNLLFTAFQSQIKVLIYSLYKLSCHCYNNINYPVLLTGTIS